MPLGIRAGIRHPESREPRSIAYRREAGILFSYLLVSLAILYPLVPRLASRLPFAGNGDVRLGLTILFSNLQKIASGDLLNLYQLPIVFPWSHVLTAGVNLFGQTLLALPLYLLHLRNPYLIYNFLTFFSYVAAGYCAYRFVGEWLSERWIAWLVGALYILLPYRVHNIPQLNLQFSFAIPLALLFFSRFLKNGRGRDLALFWVSLLGQFLFDLSLGIFLVAALGLFFLLWQVFFGLQPRRSWLLLAGAAALFAVAVVALFLPYLSPKTSFSIVDEARSIPDFAFHSGLSFYNNWSYLLLFAKRIVWHHPPFSPGIVLSAFFMLAFVPYLTRRREKAAGIFCAFFLVLPALAVPLAVGRLPFAAIDRACTWVLGLFLLGLACLLFLLRRKAPAGLLLLASTWGLLQFFSSRASLPLFNPFRFLARWFTILLRTRFIRSEYILTLLFFAVAAYGISHFFRRFHGRRLLLALALLLVFAERLRWPVVPESLEGDRPGTRELYRVLAPYPGHFGLLELPSYPLHTNHYPLFTVYHDKHTYHGLINYLCDHDELAGDPRLQGAGGFPGLADRQLIRRLKAGGLRLVLLFKDRIFTPTSEGQRDWLKLKETVRRGEELGLYEEVVRAPHGILLVLGERERGPRIRYFLPHYALRGKRTLSCTVDAGSEATAEFLFNGKPAGQNALRPGERNTVAIELKGAPLQPQFNYLEVRSGPSLELLSVRLE
jgi:hypothetical protein